MLATGFAGKLARRRMGCPAICCPQGDWPRSVRVSSGV